jgi:YihY family inner membrane protein
MTMASQDVLRHPASQQAGQRAQGGSLKERVMPLVHFWQKLSNDWIFNLAGLLAYNFLLSIFPILLALLAIAGFILNTISPGSEQQLVNAIAGALPGGASGTGGVIVKVALTNLQRQAGVLFVVGLVMAIFTGSRLFVTIENCFGIIFRLRGRNLIRQNIMAIGMLLLYIVLVPIVFLASIVPSAIVGALHASGAATGIVGVLINLAGLLVAFLVALVLFTAIYMVVPNRPVHFSEVWKGTLIAAVLLVLYEFVFPIYQSIALRSNSYGSVAGFAIVILVFFYYLAVILLLGAEINSWISGQRETASDIAAILHEVQAHNTTLGAAGPTAGMPQEDKQHHQGARAMATPERAQHHEDDDHHSDVHPAITLPEGEKQP